MNDREKKDGSKREELESNVVIIGKERKEKKRERCLKSLQFPMSNESMTIVLLVF